MYSIYTLHLLRKNNSTKTYDSLLKDFNFKNSEYFKGKKILLKK